MLDSIAAIKTLVDTSKSLIDLFRTLAERCKDPALREEVEQALVDAETRMKLAQAESAKSMGFPLCECTWPPNIMLYRRAQDANVCPECGRTYRKGPAFAGRRLQFPV